MNEMQQYSRKGNTEIFGMPLTENENVFDIIKELAALIKVHMIENTFPRLIDSQASLCSLCRDQHVKNGLWPLRNANQFSQHLPTSRVYANEHLTPLNKALLTTWKKKGNLIDFVGERR